MNRNFKPPFFMTGAISQDRERCQFFFLLDEKPTVVPVGSVGEQSGGAQEVPYGAVRSNSERAAPSAWVGKRFSAPQIVWNRSTRRAGARGGARVGRPRWLRILMITGGSSILGSSLCFFDILDSGTRLLSGLRSETLPGIPRSEELSWALVWVRTRDRFELLQPNQPAAISV
jgi:hypothetical protein